VVGKDYERVKLGDICKFLPKSKRPASFGKKGGGYNFYTSSNTIQKCDIADYNEECLIIGDGGVANIKIDKGFSCSGHNHIIKTKYNNYLYSLLNGNIDMLAYGFKGSTLKNLSKEYLINLQIPIPKSPLKMKEWVDKISVPYHEKNEKQLQIKELELFVQEKIGGLSEYDEVELGSVCEIKYGKRITQKKNKGTQYVAYGGGDIMTYKVDEYNRSGVTYKVSRDGLSEHNCISKIYGKIFLNDTALSLHTTTDSITDGYIGETLLCNKSYIYKECSHGSAQLHIDLDCLMKIKIKIPKNKQFIDELEETFQQIETLQQEVKMADNLYNQYIQELSQEAMPTLNKVIEPEVEIVVETPKPKKEKSKVSKIFKE
jgi:hypothetical protein